MSVERFYEADPDGHRSYESLEHFLEVLRGYYPDKNINSESLLTVLEFKDIQVEANMQWYRDGDIDHLLDTLEQQLLEEDMTSASRDMIVKGTFQRIRDTLDTLASVKATQLTPNN